tara:strand:+ start:91 stop:516 length:426 start_codon:yes stop_codon:yes gene_type:complete
MKINFHEVLRLYLQRAFIGYTILHIYFGVKKIMMMEPDPNDPKKRREEQRNKDSRNWWIFCLIIGIILGLILQDDGDDFLVFLGTAGSITVGIGIVGGVIIGGIWEDGDKKRWAENKRMREKEKLENQIDELQDEIDELKK